MARNTKIVCTLGPASSSPEMIGRLVAAGMDVVRLNFSHGTHPEHAATIERVRERAAAERRFLPILADLQGPKIRTGLLEGGEPVELADGARIRVAAGDGRGNQERLLIHYPRLTEDLRPGDRILLADGAIELRVLERQPEELVCQVVHGGALGERKGVHFPGVALALPSLTEKDKSDLQFAIAQGVDYIALSFVREAKDLRLTRGLIGWAGVSTPLIAKIEKGEALAHLDEILEAADGVMVARGDLGVELSPAQVPIEQKRIIARARELRKPVITATQMLESMIGSARPTRAEASDVANAVLDGSDAVMLSGETAVGRFPVAAVAIMGEIIERAETAFPWLSRAPAPPAGEQVEISDAVAETAVSLSVKLGVRVILVYTESGYTARLISKHRPPFPIVGFSRHPRVCHQMGLLWGVRPKPAREITDLDQLVLTAESALLSDKMVERGDLICVVAGTPFAVPGKTDLIKLHRVGCPDL